MLSYFQLYTTHLHMRTTISQGDKQIKFFLSFHFQQFHNEQEVEYVLKKSCVANL